jgi:integrase
MSGGPYGRGKAPERACMKLALWPERDRALWLGALSDDDIFGDGGDRAGHRPASNWKTEKGYGRWLTFLAIKGLLDTAVHPADRITPDTVRLYIEALQAAGNGTQTQMGRLQELGEMAKIMDPGRDWSFIAKIASRIRARHKPVRDKRLTFVSSVELLELGLKLMDTAAGYGTRRQQAVAYRDGLLIAFLTLVPIRRKNLAELSIGETLIQAGDVWVISLPGGAMKNEDPLDRLWPEILLPYLQTYLDVHRPYLASLTGRWTGDIGGALWVSTDGSRMTQMALYERIRARTKDAFGHAVNPHAFRHAAPTTWAIEDPATVGAASAHLGHRSSQSMEAYKLPRTIEAGRLFAKTLERAAKGTGTDD